MKCRDCPARAANGKATCARCLAKHAERVRAFRAKQRQRGGCVYCTAPALAGMSMCDAHRNYFAAMRDTEKYRGYQRRLMKALRAAAKLGAIPPSGALAASA